MSEPTQADREALADELATLRGFKSDELREFAGRLTMLAAHLHSEHEEDALITHSLARLLYVLGCEGQRG